LDEVSRRARPWAWIPSLYFAQGIPYVIVVTVSVIMYKRLGVSNAVIAFITSWLYLPWTLKPLWSPFVELHLTKRWWTVAMQLTGAAATAGIAVALQLPGFVLLTLAVFAVMAVASATHDIACDGFYMLALPEREQAAFVGVRSTLYRIAMVSGQGLLVILAGWLEERRGSIPAAWSLTFLAVAVVYGTFALYHMAVLPRPVADVARRAMPDAEVASGGTEYATVFASFFRKPGIATILAFLLLYRFAEAQLVKMVTPFLLDSRGVGGLGLSTSEVGFAYGTVGIMSLTFGGLLGGWVASRVGFRRMLWIFVIAIHLPDAIFIWLARAQPSSLTVVSAALAVEQFGYGFGFTAYTLFLLMIAAGPHRTAHYAIGTGFMALGMMLPGMFSGAIQESLGYRGFFVWVLLSTIPGFVVPALVRIDPAFGRR
jgi:MFS transporter, PAT family, beta-lactamase induction signal transducer AmpG